MALPPELLSNSPKPPAPPVVVADDDALPEPLDVAVLLAAPAPPGPPTLKTDKPPAPPVVVALAVAAPPWSAAAAAVAVAAPPPPPLPASPKPSPPPCRSRLQMMTPCRHCLTWPLRRRLRHRNREERQRYKYPSPSRRFRRSPWQDSRWRPPAAHLRHHSWKGRRDNRRRPRPSLSPREPRRRSPSSGPGKARSIAKAASRTTDRSPNTLQCDMCFPPLNATAPANRPSVSRACFERPVRPPRPALAFMTEPMTPR